jgi:hypothetical protein
MRFISLLKASLFVAPALVAAAPAAAQPAQQAAQPPAEAQPAVPADPNAIRGSIQVCEAARGEHRIQLEGGRRYSITANSEAFDPYIRLLRPGSEEPIAEDDDSGGGLVPRVVFSPPQSGEYIVRVSSFAPGGVGDYSLSVTPASPLPPLVSRPTRTERGQWQIFQGDLAAGDATENGKHYDDYELRLAAGQTAMIHVQADNMDTMLQVFPAADRGNRPVAEDDDSGGGTNPFVFFAPEEAGTYVVRVVGFDEQSAGAYRLRISR